MNYRPGGYGRRAKSHFGDARTLLEAVQVVATLRPGTAPIMRRIVQRADSPTVRALTDRIPAHRMTATAKRFCTEMVHANRTELLNLLKDIP